MPKLDLFDLKAKKIDTIDVKDEIFGIEPNTTVMHEVLVAELAAARQGTASTKTRAMVRGGGRKPYRQKGTGRARQGSIRSPQFVGGGVTFGPRPRDFSKKVNKKVRKLALRSAISEKIKEEKVYVIDKFDIDKPQTKIMSSFLQNLSQDKRQLIILNDFATDNDWNTYLSARNLKDTMIIEPSEISVYGILKYDRVIITKEALDKIEGVLE